MERFVRLIGVCVLLSAPFFAHAEYIESFDSSIKISENGSFMVTEEIEYVFTEERHGIFRYIPIEHHQRPSSWFKERYTRVQVETVLMDDTPVPVEITNESSRVFIKIGDPNETITGSHRYVIVYTVDGALSYNPVTELYFNVTGTDWPVSMKRVTATISAPPGILSRERACYAGPAGRQGSCERTLHDDGSVTFTAHTLLNGQGMTIAQGINPGKVETVIYERNKPTVLWGLGLSLWFLGLSLFVYKYRTAHRTGRTIVPEYEPYPGVKPMYAGLLMDGRLDPRDITAAIVYLAEVGYLKIRKTEKKVFLLFEVDDYEISLTRNLDESVGAFERAVLELLFGDSMTAGMAVSLSTLKSDMQLQKQNHKRMQELKQALEQDLEDTGFFQVTLPTHYVLGIGVITLVLFVIWGSMFASVSPTVVLVGVVLIVSLVIVAFMHRRRTRKGYEALDHLRGFRDFLSVTDKERFEFHNAPEKSPEEFMRYLPYAIAFGVEEKWAEVFKNVSIPSPDWYQGGSVNSFSASNLSTSLGAFGTALAVSSGSSGSTGGGSVGGGGGGGGGGSW